MLSQRGSTLLESLIALLVFSIAVLGLAGLQARMIGDNTDNQFRVQAALMSEDLAGQVLADKENVGCYLTVNNVCGNLLAQTSFASWQARVQSALPNATMTSTLDLSNNFTVTLTWLRSGDAATHNHVNMINLGMRS